MTQELENLGESLCQSIAANRYEEARQLMDRCQELYTIENHHIVIAILERARRLAIVQRSLAPERFAILESATKYTAGPPDKKHYIVSG